ncbi:unnamed protein product [Lupinus luteus]|uniref:Uncharacterized protein n=1 Tax=Lupinus luteus TaxID=3873 RepID=A0AAV1WBH5_LUPLU
MVSFRFRKKPSIRVQRDFRIITHWEEQSSILQVKDLLHLPSQSTAEQSATLVNESPHAPRSWFDRSTYTFHTNYLNFSLDNRSFESPIQRLQH